MWLTTTDMFLTTITAGSTVTLPVSTNILYYGRRTETIFVYTGMLAADPVIVQLKDNEIPSSVTLASTTNANSSMLISSKTSTTGPTSSVASSPSSEQGILSSGVKAGIGVGVALGVCAIVALGYLTYRLRKHRTAGDVSTSAWERPELSNKPMETEELSNDAMKAHELPDSSRQELSGHHAVAEGHDQS